VINRDVVVDETTSWNWKDEDDVVTHVPSVFEEKIKAIFVVPNSRRIQRQGSPLLHLLDMKFMVMV